MKAFKKITALAVAMTMGCSVIAFAACNKEDGEDGGEVDTVNLPTGMPAQTVDAAFVSALEEVQEYLSISYANKISGTDKHYSVTGGVKTDIDTTTYEINLSASGKVDLTEGNADLVATSVATYESTDKDKDFSQRLADNNFIEYGFLRDWEMYSYKSPDNKEVTDFTGLTLSYDGSAKIDWEAILGQIGSIGGGATSYAEESPVLPDLSILPQTGDLAPLSLLVQNVVLVNLAAAANTLEYENGVYSIDLIKTVHTVIEEVGSVVYALKGENTVGDILNNAIIKKYFSVITELLPVETVKDTVASAIDGLPAVENVKPLLLFIQQDLDALKTIKASTTYDYIVSLVSSQNLVNILNTVMTIAQSQSGVAATSAASTQETVTEFFTKTLDKYTLNEILLIVNSTVNSPAPITLQVLKNAYKFYVEPVCDGEKLITASNGAITELSVEYKVEGGKLASQKVNYAFENGDAYEIGEGGSDGIVTYYYTDTKEKQEGTLVITYETSAPVLKNIDVSTAIPAEKEEV